MYIADTDNNRVRKVTVSTGIITTIAGTDTAGYKYDNIQASSASLNGPFAVDIDAAGNYYFQLYMIFFYLKYRPPRQRVHC